MFRLRRTVRRASFFLVLFVLLGSAPAYGQTTTDPPPPVIADGVTVAGVAVGGLTADEATTAVRTFFARPFTFTFHGHTWTSGPARVGASVDYPAVVAAALAAAPSTALSLPVSVYGPT